MFERRCCTRSNRIADDSSKVISAQLPEKENIDSKDTLGDEEVAWPEASRVFDIINMFGYLIMYLAGNMAYFLDIYIGTRS